MKHSLFNFQSNSIFADVSRDRTISNNISNFKMAKTISQLMFLVLLAQLCTTPVAGQNPILTIKFEKFGIHDYNNGKAFMEDDLVRLFCDINGQIPSGSSVVFTRAKDDSDTDLVKLSSAQTVLVSNPDNHLSVQHNVISTDPIFVQNYRLSINDVNKYDQGFYKCRVENANGVATHVSGFTNTLTARPQLVVLYLPDANKYPECIVEEGTIDVKLGQKINIKCISEYGNPMVNLAWKRNLGAGQIEDVASTITMSPAEPEIEKEIENAASAITITADHDGDIYTCFMSPSQEFFPQGSRSCDIGPLKIVSGSLPTITPMVQNAVPGDTVWFQCDLSSKSDAVFAWYWEPNWDLEKASFSPDTKTFSFKNVRSYHHLTKVFCRTQSQGYEVSVYGLVRVTGDYEAPPNTPAPSVTFGPPAGGGSDGGSGGSGTTGGVAGGSGDTGGVGNGGTNPDSGSGGLNGRPRTTKSSSGHRIKFQKESIVMATCLLILLSLFSC